MLGWIWKIVFKKAQYWNEYQQLFVLKVRKDSIL